MELLLSIQEQQAIQEKFGIDINSFIDIFTNFERIDELLKTNDSNVNLIEEIRLVNPKKLLDDYFKYIDIKDKYYEFNSLRYYSSLEEKRFREYRNNRSSDAANKYGVVINQYLCSMYNMLMLLNEESLLTKKSDSNKILVFEACPYDSKRIMSREEALAIKNILERHNYAYFPVIRFGTNQRVFKQICNQNKIYILHLVCHGNREGIVLMGDTGTSSTMTCKSFCDFFDNEYNHRTIELCFLNCCFSNLISLKALEHNSFNHSIGYEEENDDEYALEFASVFYESIHNHKVVVGAFKYCESCFTTPECKWLYFKNVCFI